MSTNVIKKCFGELCEPLKYLCNLSIVKGIFPDDLKIAKVTPYIKLTTAVILVIIGQCLCYCVS